MKNNKWITDFEECEIGTIGSQIPAFQIKDHIPQAFANGVGVNGDFEGVSGPLD